MSKNFLADHIYIVILCGGFGPNLWPVSRSVLPKPFLKLGKNKSLLQSTYDRASSFVTKDHIWIATTSDLLPLVKKQLPSHEPGHISMEPIRRNTAWAHGLAAVYIKHLDPEAIIINLPVDHNLENLHLFKSSLQDAVKLALETGILVTIGTPPRFPHTGFAYILKGKKTHGAFRVARLISRPALPVAKRLVRSSKYLWHANMYIWKASSLINELKIKSPRIYSGLMRISKSLGNRDETAVKQSVFQMAPSTQIESVLNNSRNLLCLESDLSWSDIGNWREMSATFPRDSDGNSLSVENSKPVVVNSKNNFVFSHSGKLISLVGVNNLAVIETSDSLLIVDKSQALEVKQVVDILKGAGKLKQI